MSLTIKKKSNFKPKAAPRRPGGASTQPSARPSVERQSQTPIPSLIAESLSISGRTQDDEITREPSISEYTPQPTSEQQHQTTNTLGQDVPSSLKLHSGQHHQHDQSPIANDLSIQSTTLSSEKPIQTPTAPVRVDSSDEPTPQTASLKRKNAPNSVSSTAQKRTRIELPHSSTEANVPQILSSQPNGSETNRRVDGNDAQIKATSTSIENDTDAVAAQTTNTENLSRFSDLRQDNQSSIYPDPELSRTSGGAISQLPIGADFPTDRPLQTIGTAAINPDGSASTVDQIVHTAGMNPDGTAGQASPLATAPPKKKRTSKKAKASAIVAGDDDGTTSGRAGIEMTINKSRRVTGEKRDRKKKDPSKGRKKRGETPEGAEDEEVDPTVMTLQEICKDPKIGKKFSRAEQIREQILEREKEKKRLKLENEKLWSTTLTDDEAEDEGEGDPGREREEDGEADGEGEEGRNQERAPAVEKPQESSHVISGPQMVVGPDGRITVVQSSLQFNRNAAAEFARGGEKEQQVDDFSRLVNGGSHVKRTPKRDWTVTDEEKFWEMLREYGTDFEMMAATLGRGRTARQCKLKFRKEEKLNPTKIDRAFRGIPEPIEDEDMLGINASPTATPEEASAPGDLVKKYRREIEASLGERLEDPAVIMESLEATRKAQEEAEQEAEKEVEAENARKERDIISGQDRRNRIANGLPVTNEGGDEGNRGPFDGREASAAPRSKQKAAKRKGKKNPHSSGAYDGGADFIIESTEA